MSYSTEIILKSIIERAVKQLICRSLKILEKDFDPSIIEYYPVWKKHSSDGQKTLSKLKIRKRQEQDFFNIPIETIEKEGLIGSDMVDYLIENRSKKMPLKDLKSKSHLIFFKH